MASRILNDLCCCGRRMFVGQVKRDHKTGIRICGQNRSLSSASSSALDGWRITSPWIFRIRPRKSGIWRGAGGSDRNEFRDYLITFHNLDLFALGELGFDVFECVAEIAN